MNINKINNKLKTRILARFKIWNVPCVRCCSSNFVLRCSLLGPSRARVSAVWARMVSRCNCALRPGVSSIARQKLQSLRTSKRFLIRISLVHKKYFAFVGWRIVTVKIPLWIGRWGDLWLRLQDGSMNNSVFGRPGSTSNCDNVTRTLFREQNYEKMNRVQLGTIATSKLVKTWKRIFELLS